MPFFSGLVAHNLPHWHSCRINDARCLNGSLRFFYNLRESAELLVQPEVAFKDLAVFPDRCSQCEDCYKCKLCNPCMTAQLKAILQEAFRQHTQTHVPTRCTTSFGNNAGDLINIQERFNCYRFARWRKKWSMAPTWADSPKWTKSCMTGFTGNASWTLLGVKNRRCRFCFSDSKSTIVF